VLLRLTDEIKNPLVSIYTFLELLPHRYEDSEFRETFSTLEREHHPAAGRIGPASCATRLRPVPGRS
jgi:signal transduction histidine kinase